MVRCPIAGPATVVYLKCHAGGSLGYQNRVLRIPKGFPRPPGLRACAKYPTQKIRHGRAWSDALHGPKAGQSVLTGDWSLHRAIVASLARSHSDARIRPREIWDADSAVLSVGFGSQLEDEQLFETLSKIRKVSEVEDHSSGEAACCLVGVSCHGVTYRPEERTHGRELLATSATGESQRVVLERGAFQATVFLQQQGLALSLQRSS